MQPRTAPTLCLKDFFVWSLLLTPALAAALQQQPYDAALPSPSAHRALSVGDDRYEAPDSLRTPLSGQRQGGYRDTDTEYDRDRQQRSQSRHSTSRTPLNERALATYASANAAVGAPPATRSVASTAGLTSRQPARALQDWQVEDIILLATVDGKLHARDRTTGAAKWQLEVDRPMVETIYHRHNKSVDENGMEQEDPLWIVEPSQDGSIYVYAPSSGYGMQKLGYTVKQLAELGPYAGEGHPAVAYTAEKKSTLYTIDAGTGNVIKVFSASGTITNEDRSCKRVNPLESLDDECEPVGTLTLGRTEYTIGIQDRDTAEQISTIKYFEWGPNNRDQDLRSKYTATMDKKYVYTRHDGSFFGLSLGDREDYRPVPANKPALFRDKFSSPVARVYDVVRSTADQSGDAMLVVLPQPTGPSWNVFEGLEDDAPEQVFVNCTESGSWYALSEANYPAVTDGAPEAQCYSDDYFSLPSLPMSQHSREKFMGLHQLYAPQTHKLGTLLIDAPELPSGIDAPPEQTAIQDVVVAPPTSWSIPSVSALILAMLVGLAGAGIMYRQKSSSRADVPLSIRADIPITLTDSLQTSIQTIELPKSSTKLENPEQPEPPLLSQDSAVLPVSPTMVREAEPAEETIFPTADDDLADTPEEEDESLVRTETVDDTPEDDDVSKDAKNDKPGKHKRGKRGGKKQKEAKQAAAEAYAKKKGLQINQRAELITVAASESPQMAGPLMINNLTIHTDRIIGQGSCGTSVYEGSWEGREVAVKRMLSQYYELASQEVSFLQQSDDHPNVVRYHCQQKDDHFLYIAVELCQASLFDVWEPDKARSEARHQQLAGLKHMIQQDTPRALQQLAAGLYHLHNLRIIHRDIKPQNILVAFPKRNQNTGPRLVISDFGLGKNLPDNVSTLMDPTGNAGTSGWKAPELISQPGDTTSTHSQSHSQSSSNTPSGHGTNANGPSGIKRAADIFSLGCLFFWVLTDGMHPYEDENGWQQLRELNIKRDNKNMSALERWSDAYEPMQLITWMLENKPENRPSAAKVLGHPFFWSVEKRLSFLCDVSDHFEREARGTVEDGYAGDSWQLRLLEERAEEVIGAPFERADFLSKLDRHFVDTLGKQRKYSGNRFLDLLRALRNKKNHYEDMPEDVKRKVGPLAGGGYLGYWCTKFPRLLMACYETVITAGLGDGDRFGAYMSIAA